MKILHILNDGPTKLSEKIIAVQAEKGDVKIVDLSKKSLSYENIIEEIFSSDRVISW